MDEQELERLTASLKQGDFNTRIKIIDRLGASGDIRVIPLLITTLADNGPGDEFFALEGAFINLGKPAVHALIETMHDETYEFKHYVVQVLGDIGDPEALDVLLNAIQDPNREIRALTSFDKMGKPAVQPLLDIVANHPDREVRRSALSALGHIPDERIIAPALRWLSDDWLKASAALVLRHYQNDEVTESLINLLNDRKPSVRYSAAIALGEIRDERAVEPLLAILNDPSEDVRLHAINALGKIGSQKAVPALIALLRDDLLQSTAVRALASIGDKQAVPELQMLQRRVKSLLAAIEEALKVLGYD